jgi:ATP-dependent Clp protease adapter protein ClpS
MAGQRRKRVYLYLFNDDNNAIAYVDDILRTICNKNPIAAAQIIRIVETTGRCQVTSGFEPAIFHIYALLVKAGLIVKLTEKQI